MRENEASGSSGAGFGWGGPRGEEGRWHLQTGEGVKARGRLFSRPGATQASDPWILPISDF